MLHTYFATTEPSSSGILGFNLQVFAFQLITFVLIFLVLKKFAFDKIIAILDERHKVIDEGVRHGQQMKKEREDFEKETSGIAREARHQADEIISDAQKEARDIIREAEKAASKKSDVILRETELRVNEEVEQAKRKLEKDVAVLVSDATEAVVDEKIDAKKDSELIDKAIKKGRKK